MGLCSKSIIHTGPAEAIILQIHLGKMPLSMEEISGVGSNCMGFHSWFKLQPRSMWQMAIMKTIKFYKLMLFFARCEPPKMLFLAVTVVEMKW